MPALVRTRAGFFTNGSDGIRTHDFHVANVTLSQLSYRPMDSMKEFYSFLGQIATACLTEEVSYPTFIFSWIPDLGTQGPAPRRLPLAPESHHFQTMPDHLCDSVHSWTS